MNWIKSSWSAYLSVIAIICSIIAICIALPSNRDVFGLDYIGVLVGILSLLVTVLIGWQIWSVISIDKKIAKEVDNAKSALMENIEKTRENLAISGARSAAAILYKAESINLNVYLLAGNGNQQMIVNTLELMVHYATSLNERETLNDVARLIVEAKRKIDNMGVKVQDYEKVCSSFLIISQTVLTRLSASDAHVPFLLKMINDIQKRKAAIQ